MICANTNETSLMKKGFRRFFIFSCFLVTLLMSCSDTKDDEVQLSRNPNIIWDETFSSYSSDVPREVINTKDGGFLISAFSHGSGGDMTKNVRGVFTDFWILKIDDNGRIIWQNTIGGSTKELFPDIIETQDGGFLVGGTSFSGRGQDKTEDSRGLEDYWVVKLNAAGAIQWDKTIGGQGEDVLSQVLENSDGYLLGGTSYSSQSGDKNLPNKGGADIWLVQLDKSGEPVWQRSYGGDTHDIMHSITISNDGGYLIAANSKSSSSGDKTEPRYGGGDAWIFKINGAGEVIWDKTIGSSLPEYLTKIIELPSGKIVAGGTAPSKVNGNRTAVGKGFGDFWIVGISHGGDILWQKSYGGDDEEVLSSMTQIGDNLFVTGISRSGISGDKSTENLVWNDAWLLKLDLEGELIQETTLRGDVSDSPVGLVETADKNLLVVLNSTSRKFPDKSENNITQYEGIWVVKLTRDWD